MHSSTLFSFGARYPIITCRVSPPASPPVASLSLPSSSSDSLACSLQCPHFESCSGCTQEFNLQRPPVVDEASGFFKRYGVEDFTFDSCRLVRFLIVMRSFILEISPGPARNQIWCGGPKAHNNIKTSATRQHAQLL
ncbi:hypothetical protein Bca52824_096164 [Brassica carinata]|uniref:Uncharacterized protein n=1 Tax=Brassica carinata TaxID=52824 RepID=A0A8X7NYZ9_BRACI|nr:hypothetical protein Bca52824_096164 [Brassica carinata]